MAFEVFSLANTRGRGEQERQADEALKRQQDQENTQWATGAMKSVLDNWSQPGALEGFMGEAQKRGMDFSAAGLGEGATKQGAIKLYRELVTAAGGDAQQKKTPAITNYEYGQDNPEFAAAQAKSPSGSVPSDIQIHKYYAGLSPADREVFKAANAPSGGGMSSALEKRLYDVNDKVVDARGKASRYNRLAAELVRVNPDSGKVAEWTESYKRVMGTEDAVSLLRKEWNQLRVGAAIQNLPPGVASDKDIELVMSAFLPEFADPGTVAAFMRGLAKIETLNAEYSEFEADWLSTEETPQGMNQAWRKHLGSYTAPDGSESILQQARDALAATPPKDRSAVEQMLRDKGIDPRRLDE